MSEDRAARHSADTGVARFGKNAIGGAGRKPGPSAIRSTSNGGAGGGATGRHLQISGPGWSALERDVYESIARSLTVRREAGAGSRVGAAHKAS